MEEDGEARLAHAFFALWNQPAKLAAIGTYWPPLETLALLPFAAIRPLATSLVALPLSSGPVRGDAPGGARRRARPRRA